MAYASSADLVERFGEEEMIQLSDRIASADLDEIVLLRALTDASALIDGALTGRYALPLADVPALLVGVCCDLARFALYDDAAPDLVRERKTDALARLRDLANGTLRLDLSTAETPRFGLCQVSVPTSVFGRSS